MSKERLEGIRTRVKGLEGLESVEFDIPLIVTDMNWLTEQNKRYREAIEFGIEYFKNSDIRQVQLVVTGLESALEAE